MDSDTSSSPRPPKKRRLDKTTNLHNDGSISPQPRAAKTRSTGGDRQKFKMAKPKDMVHITKHPEILENLFQSQPINPPSDNTFLASSSTTQQPIIDTAALLDDLPSDAFEDDFSSSPAKPNNDNAMLISSAAPSQLTQSSRLPDSQSYRQTTLFGGTASNFESSQPARKSRPLTRKDEPLTHHKINREAMKTWVYPVNIGSIRDYQFNIVQRGLFHNLLVALPTGLGKTFIAATVMLNWFRWTSDAQIVFVAPTKPLVSQQVDACFHIAGIPRSQTTMLTGGIPPGIRAEEWQNKRVFFMTPQTIINDLKTGICDPKRIVLLVVDEAHRATGNYAYVEVVSFLRRFNSSFRVLALTATPGASVEAVQAVVDHLDISRVEIRTEKSIDIQPYVHSRKVETEVFEISEEMGRVMDLFSKALQPLVNKLVSTNAYWARDPMKLTPYGLTLARQQWAKSEAGKKASWGIKGMVNTIMTVLSRIAFSIDLLKYHGIGPFYHNMVGFRDADDGGGKYRQQIIHDENFCKMMSTIAAWVSNPDFLGHPKLEYLQTVVLNHFLDAGQGQGLADGRPPSETRIIVFAHYRDSAEEIVRILKKHQPMIRPHVFVGQQGTARSEGMDQKSQLEIMDKFKRGVYNTLVATSIGEEGLDIGEVDLIVCYDSSASPIRMLQRMGRTGRKRAGNIVILLLKGKEEESFVKAKDNYEKMQEMIASGKRFEFHEDRSPRVVPKEIQPVPDKRVIDIPIENSQPSLPEPKKRARAPKRPPKRFNMPDGVRTGFVKASRLQDNDENDDEQEVVHRKSSPQAEDVPALEEVLLTSAEERELERNYLNVGGDEPQTVESARLDAFPALQRVPRPTCFISHGHATSSLVTTLNKMHAIDLEAIETLQKLVPAPDDSIWGDSLDDNDSSEGILSVNSGIRVSPPAKSRKRRYSPPRDSLTPEVADEEDYFDSDLANFLVDDESDDENIKEMDTAVSITSSLEIPGMGDASKPFYLSQQTISQAGSDDDDELPDIDELIEGATGSIAKKGGESTNKGKAPTKNSRGRLKRVICDDSDEE
ncbi:MAG: 3'-5' DNA helicase [Cirrosporium novae-zelandiae]|nr:MAG: 3'-5' DNA helicase [Cirrosporium novae-zelandiae]